MNNPQIHFISGVCGVGKSSTLVHLRNMLPADSYDVHDFDERGVPDGGGREWHDNETLYWLEVAAQNAGVGKSTIVCGFAEPEQFAKVHNKEKHVPAHLFLLDASSDTMRQRLAGRYPTAESIEEINRTSGLSREKFIDQMVADAPTIRGIFEKAGAPVIETDAKTPEEIAKEIIELISQ